MKHHLLFLMVIILSCSCGNKVVQSDDAQLKTIDTYIAEVNRNSNLTSNLTEGALTDLEGFKDIGTFKYTVYFDERSRELFRIKNIEMVDETIEENYYFQNHELVYVTSVISGKRDKTMYTQGFKKAISRSNISDDEEKLLLKKAKRFKNAHYRIDD
ncbi:hypothetical protein [Psychroserpens sp.]|uniref:hypothetical protein n=1 Tax=Psychroserpens sp. TaxID=2020870 RepID=UPI003C722210